MPETPQVISVDIKGVVKVKHILKIWDIRNYQNVQTINLNETMHSFCLTFPKKKIILASHRLQYFEYDEIVDANICDEYPCIKVII